MTTSREGPQLVLVDGATQLRGIRGLIGLLRRWPRLRRGLMSTDGYVAHRIYIAGRSTIGLLTWWHDERALVRFAHGRAHHEIWAWAGTKNRTKGGWLVTYNVGSGGPLWGTGTPLAQRFAPHLVARHQSPSQRCPAHSD